MSHLVTGTAIGNLDAQEELFLEGAPTIFIQNNLADPLNNPGGDGFYWGLSGTTTYPAFEIGCITDVSLTENLTVNDVLCDNVGVKDVVQQRNSVDFIFTVQSLFPYQTLTNLLNTGAVTETSPTQKFGMGPINNNLWWMVYAPKVYDETAGDYIWIHLHRAKFVDAWTINMPFGSPWQITGLRLRGLVDSTKPSDQRIGMWGRSDLSVIP